MSTLIRTRAAAALLAALVLTGLSGCGDANTDSPADPATTDPSPDAVDGDGAGNGDWLLRFSTADGADGERVGAVYVTYNPATGAAAARKVPPVNATDASPDEEVLLVSADHAWAIQDTGVPKGEAATGRLVLYSVTSEETRTVDIRALTGKPDLRARGWAFDPVDANVLRVVDADQAVWKVDLAGATATQEGTLPSREGWIFGNGFDKNSGQPYIESIDSDETEPAGNGDSDTRPVTRQGGTPIRYDGDTLDGLPKPPCEFAGGFRFDDGAAWLFCADTPSITAYRLAAGGGSWEQDGTPSTGVVPDAAVELAFVLPPLD
jgi:hypothetical protein